MVCNIGVRIMAGKSLAILLILICHFSVSFATGNMSRQAVLNVLLGIKETNEQSSKYDSSFSLDLEKGKNSKYDSSIAPDFEKDVPTVVTIQILIQNIYSVSESSMDYSLDIFLRQKWEDNRLKYENMTDLEWLEMDNKMMDKVWVPDTYFSNEKKASVHDVTVPNKMMHLYKNGTVLYSSRLSLTLSCNMKLHKYPLDDQTCPIVVESYAYTVDNVVYTWDNDSSVKILKNSDVEMPQFQAYVDDSRSVSCNEFHVERGKFACLRAFIRLHRKVGYYIVQVFVPSILIVVLSWVSFWVDHDAVPARVSLGVLTVLTMTTQSSGAKQSLPQVSYVKAIDVWMFTCLLFVFMALVEYSYVNVVARKRTKALLQQRYLELQPLRPDQNKEENGQIHTVQKGNLVRHEIHIAARRVDKISRVVFPACFVIFNTIFWTYYSLIPSPA